MDNTHGPWRAPTAHEGYHGSTESMCSPMEIMCGPVGRTHHPWRAPIAHGGHHGEHACSHGEDLWAFDRSCRPMEGTTAPLGTHVAP